MALTTYSELQAAVRNWGTRASDLDSRIPEFITLFEGWANRKFRVREQQSSTSITISSGTGSLPSDFLAPRAVVWTGSPSRTLTYASWDYTTETYPTSPSGTPDHYMISSTSIYVMPVDNTALTLHYFKKITALSSSVNWLFTAHPDLYLFGSMAEKEAYVKDAEKAMLWKARRDEIAEEIIRLDMKWRDPGAIRMQNVVTP